MKGSGLLFIVDGQEAEVFRHLCPKAEFRRHQNGKISIEQLGKQCADLIEKAPPFEYCIITADLEKRGREKPEISYDEMAQQLMQVIRDTLNCTNEFAEKIKVGIPDRMIENWYYAGLTGENIDGQHGTSKMHELGSYSKTTSEITLIKNGFSLTNALSSPSFSAFITEINFLKCNYLVYRN